MAKGGAQPGAGRKKGTMNKGTLEKLQVLNEYRQRIYKQAEKLLHAQLSLAIGTQYVFKMIPTKRGLRAELVTSTEEIIKAIDSMQMGTVESATEGSYFTITTKDPNPFAIDSMLNRAFGKPKDEETQPENDDEIVKTGVQLPDGSTLHF